MKRFAFLLLGGSFLLACATENSTSNGGSAEGGSGAGDVLGGSGGDGASVSAGGETQGGGGDGGEGGVVVGCEQNCNTIDVPPCFVAVCNLDTGNCDIGPAEDGEPCEDGEFCTVDDKCLAGACEGGDPMDCTNGDPDPCLTSVCDEGLDTCESTPAANGTLCTSTNVCLTNTQCFNGQCQGAPMDCSATPLTSPECQAAQCDPSNGMCAVVAINDGIACTYGDICQSNKTCDMGLCEGTPIVGCTACTETEPNNTYLTANSGMGCASWSGGITVNGDVDCFAIDVTVPGSRIAAQVVDVNGAGCPTGFDSEQFLYSASGTELAYDDQSGDVSCSAFLPSNTATTNLAVGTYYVCVGNFFSGTSPPYLLTLSALPPGCGNGIKEAAEECDGTAFGTSTCITEGFGSGTLQCDASCMNDTSACVPAACGNGILEGGEQCDDGNLMNGDNCSSTCTLTIYDCAVGQTQLTISSTTVPQAIPDVSTIMNTITVPNVGTLTKVALELNITHTYDADLDISLDAPGAALIDLSSDNGGGAENFIGTVFALGFPSITTGAAPFTGVYTPEGNLATIVGTQSNGPWVLTITDDLGGDFGTLDGWTLHLCVQ